MSRVLLRASFRSFSCFNSFSRRSSSAVPCARETQNAPSGSGVRYWSSASTPSSTRKTAASPTIGLPAPSISARPRSIDSPGPASFFDGVTTTLIVFDASDTLRSTVPAAKAGRPRSSAGVAPAGSSDAFRRPRESVSATVTFGMCFAVIGTSTTCADPSKLTRRDSRIPSASTESSPSPRGKGLFTSSFATSPTWYSVLSATSSRVDASLRRHVT